MRLLSVYTYCKVISELNGEYATAKTLAEQSFSAASSLSNSLDDAAIKLLQRLRDDYMCLSDTEILLLSGLEHTMHHEHVDEEIDPDAVLEATDVTAALGTTTTATATLV